MSLLGSWQSNPLGYVCPSWEFCTSVLLGHLCVYKFWGFCSSLEWSVCQLLHGKVYVSAPSREAGTSSHTYPKEVAQGHREANGEGRGAQGVSTAFISGGEDAEHQLQGQE